MLADVFVVPFAKERRGSMEVFGVKRQRVEFVIAHDGQSIVLLHHWPNNFQHLPDLWPSVDEVAEKDHFAFGVLVNALCLLVAKNIEQLEQVVGMAVNVADQVVHGWEFRPEGEFWKCATTSTIGLRLPVSVLMCFGHHLQPSVAWLSCLLKDRDGEPLDYQHFGPPFLLAVDCLFARVCNLTCRYLPYG